MAAAPMPAWHGMRRIIKNCSFGARGEQPGKIGFRNFIKAAHPLPLLNLKTGADWPPAKSIRPGFDSGFSAPNR
jgi:hypothetical protein